MIERDRSELSMVCDSTGLVFPESFDDLESLVEAAKANRWRITREHGEWRHYSPESQSAISEFANFDNID